MSLIKIFSPVIDIYCGLNQITIEFHLAHEFFDPWAPSFFSELRTPPHPSPPSPSPPLADCVLQLAVGPKETVVILSMHTQNISVLHSWGPEGRQ